MTTPLTRREILKGAAVGVGALGVGATSAGPARAAKRDRVAIIGAGAGGIAAAYFLAGTYDVDVFEARSRIGGHCDSRTIDYKGHRVTVDLGAQFFHPDTHPLYVTLLEELGLYDPANPDSRKTHVCAGQPVHVPGAAAARRGSHRPIRSTRCRTRSAFANFTQLARQAVLDGLAWEVTVDEWIASLPLEPAFKADVLYPWITATIGCSRADAGRVSARSILQTFALAFPENPAAGASTYNSRIGLQGNLQRMLDRVPAVRVHRNAPVRALTRSRDGWTLRTPAGRKGPYRYVVMNAPPHVGRELLRPLPAFSDVTALLDRVPVLRLAPADPQGPGLRVRGPGVLDRLQRGVDGRECEGSAWIGALHDPLPSGATVDVFKSWA